MMKKIFVLIIIFLVLLGCKNKIKKDITVKVISQYTKQQYLVFKENKAASGTGIIVDKENGLILTARHGVYRYDRSPKSYKNENLFRNIRIVDKKNNKISGYVVHISPHLDLTLIKVDHKFSHQANFIDSDFLKIRDKVDYEGYPGGRYGAYTGNIANFLDKYFELDMQIAEGMSGGPLLVDGGVVGIVILKQEIGGTALRAEIIKEYLASALEEAKRVKKYNYSLCLDKVTLSPSARDFVMNRKSELYLKLYVNDEEILNTERVKAKNGQGQWNCTDKNKFKITLLPGDKIQFELMEIPSSFFSVRSAIFEEVIEELPQKGLPVLDSVINIKNNSIFFKRY